MAQTDQAVAELATLRDLIRWGASQFNAAGLHFGHGTDNALDEAAYLVAHAVHFSPVIPPNLLDTRTTTEERKRAVALLRRRTEERLPAPYLVNEAWFCGMPFYVDERVLVPRSPIAELIEERFAPWVEPAAVGSILDMCTGSGCIAIACAHAFPEARVVGADLSSDALDVAERNAELLGAELEWVRSDLFADLGVERFDIIVSNPPYVDAAEMAALPAEYRHEPALALAAGEEGLDLAIRLLREARDHLNPAGILIVEVGASQPALEAAFPEVPFTWLEFERGGDGVFLLTAEQVAQYHDQFSAAAGG